MRMARFMVVFGLLAGFTGFAQVAGRSAKGFVVIDVKNEIGSWERSRLVHLSFWHRFNANARRVTKVVFAEKLVKGFSYVVEQPVG